MLSIKIWKMSVGFYILFIGLLTRRYLEQTPYYPCTYQRVLGRRMWEVGVELVFLQAHDNFKLKRGDILGWQILLFPSLSIYYPFRTMWSQDCDVVLVGCTIDLGKPRGVGKSEWGEKGEGEVSLRATWDKGGRDRTTQEEGFQVSKRDSRERGN